MNERGKIRQRRRREDRSGERLRNYKRQGKGIGWSEGKR